MGADSFLRLVLQHITMLLLSIDGRALEKGTTHWTRSCQTSCAHRKWPVTALVSNSCQAEEVTSVYVVCSRLAAILFEGRQQLV